MMDRIVPGGVAVDLTAEGRDSIAGLINELSRAFPPLIRIYDEKASLQDRTVGTGGSMAAWSIASVPAVMSAGHRDAARCPPQSRLCTL